MENYNILTNKVSTIALEASEIIIKAHQSLSRQTTIKNNNPRNLVTETDLEVEEFLIKKLKELLPQSHILSEETSSTIEDSILKNESVWIIDPIDGTNNFAHGNLHFCISIALSVAGEVVLALIHAPLLNETYTATLGNGAFLNKKQITVSSATQLEEAILVTGFPYEREKYMEQLIANLRSVLMRARGLRRYGSAALDLCWVAAGRLDGYFETTLNYWDVAAGSLILREAGGIVTSYNPELLKQRPPLNLYCQELLAGNEKIAEELARILVSNK